MTDLTELEQRGGVELPELWRDCRMRIVTTVTGQLHLRPHRVGLAARRMGIARRTPGDDMPTGGFLGVAARTQIPGRSLQPEGIIGGVRVMADGTSAGSGGAMLVWPSVEILLEDVMAAEAELAHIGPRRLIPGRVGVGIMAKGAGPPRCRAVHLLEGGDLCMAWVAGRLFRRGWSGVLPFRLKIVAALAGLLGTFCLMEDQGGESRRNVSALTPGPGEEGFSLLGSTSPGNFQRIQT